MKVFVYVQWAVLTVLFIGAVTLAVYTYARHLPAKIAGEALETAIDVIDTIADVIVPRRVTAMELRPLLLQRVESICQYTNSYSGTYHFVDSTEISRTLFGADWLDWLRADGRMEITAVIPGTVYAYLDLDNIEITSISITGQDSPRPTAHVTIRTAHATIDPERPCELEHSAVSFFRPEVHNMNSSEKRDSLISLWNSAMVSAKNALVEEALDNGLLESTEAHFREDMTDLLTTLGFVADVTIEFTGRGTTGRGNDPSGDRPIYTRPGNQQVGR